MVGGRWPQSVIGPHSQEVIIHYKLYCEIILLGEAVSKINDFAMSLNVLQHFGDGGGSEADIYEEGGEKEVHGY